MTKTYLITGATSDLGISFLKKLDSVSKKGEVAVYGTYFSNVDLANDLQNEISNLQLRLIKCNLADSEDVERMIKNIGEDVPTHFVHIAAKKFEYMRMKDFDWEKVKDELDVQVGSFAYILRWLLPLMAVRNFGRIIAIGTSYLIGVPPKYLSNYVLTKYALLGLVKSSAVEYAGRNVTCNMISPDMMETKFLSLIDWRTAEINAKKSVMKRNVELDEVVASILHLLSDEAGYINGINLNISGGNYM